MLLTKTTYIQYLTSLCSIVIHLAAESHVDRSISNPMSFVKTNILGTVILLNAFKKYGIKAGKKSFSFM